MAYLKYFLILKSLYFKSKMTCNRIPVYFVLKHTLEKRGQDVFRVLCLPLSTIKAVTATCSSQLMQKLKGLLEKHSNTVHFFTIYYSDDFLNISEFPSFPVVPPYTEVNLLNWD